MEEMDEIFNELEGDDRDEILAAYHELRDLVELDEDDDFAAFGDVLSEADLEDMTTWVDNNYTDED